MKKLSNYLFSGFKEPMPYYILGSITLIFGVLSVVIDLIIYVPYISYVLFIILGLLAMLIGAIISLSKINASDIQDDKLETILNSIKNEHIKNIVRNTYKLCKNYRSLDTHLCRFCSNTGAVFFTFVQSEEQVNEYLDWYLNKCDEDYKIINITKNRVTKIQPSDIEEFEHKRVSILHRIIINPIAAFLKQPINRFLSFSKILMLTIITIIIVGIYHYIMKQNMFSGAGSIETAKSIISVSRSIMSVSIFLLSLGTICIGLTTIRNVMNNYYADRYRGVKTLADQLVILCFFPFAYNLVLIPIIRNIIELSQVYGYFLP
ncbi:hypothetical protein NE686_17405 [Tissierella carlieri]|uniref:Uncharacterized protein n=1 Tax=Tissierella carlieri TaxID=689904 RepID=A0ABT1SEH5_9FIRM|nr:hypothetical protein [Tissierella carlieri]MCQ4924883.1 hypothetical protein [Tissierella carlieri]